MVTIFGISLPLFGIRFRVCFSIHSCDKFVSEVCLLRIPLTIRHLFAYAISLWGDRALGSFNAPNAGASLLRRAEDPQAHLQDPEPRPNCRLLVTCSCCWSAFLYPPEKMFNGTPAPSPECHRRARMAARTDNARLIAAAVIAAIRLNREEIKDSPVIQRKIADSLRLAEMIVATMQR